MILKVTFDETTYNSLPHKFEAGTPNIAGAIGLMHAIEYLKEIDFDGAIDHEMTVHDYALKQLKLLPNLKVIGAAKDKSSIISLANVLPTTPTMFGLYNIVPIATVLSIFEVKSRNGL